MEYETRVPLLHKTFVFFGLHCSSKPMTKRGLSNFFPQSGPNRIPGACWGQKVTLRGRGWPKNKHFDLTNQKLIAVAANDRRVCKFWYFQDISRDENLSCDQVAKISVFHWHIYTWVVHVEDQEKHLSQGPAGLWIAIDLDGLSYEPSCFCCSASFHLSLPEHQQKKCRKCAFWESPIIM